MHLMPIGSRVRCIMPLLLVAVFIVGPAHHVDAASKRAEFRATYTTTGVATPCGTLTVCVSVEGQGQGTRLGRHSTLAKSAVVHIGSTPCAFGRVSSYTADITLTAENGDTLMLNGSGTSCAGPGGIQASGVYTVTGGTGRFSGATGTLTETISRVGAGPEVLTLAGNLAHRRSRQG